MKPRSGRAPLRRVDGVVLLDKPLGLSSNDALQRVKRLFRAQKAGHTGSLDPLATGLLPICLGEATKLCGVLLDGDKHYLAGVLVGASTTTGDAEGEILATSDPTGLGREQVEAAARSLVGEIEQVPPMYSALKHQGQALYELARAGQQIERAPRRVRIHRLDVLEFTAGRLTFEVVCSKGTYVRTLAEDLLARVGQQAHLRSLRRLGAEPFDAPATQHTFDALQRLAEAGPDALDGALLPPAQGLRHWPSWRADASQLALLAQGRQIRVATSLPPGRLAVLDEAGALRGLARVDEQGRVAPERWLLS